MNLKTYYNLQSTQAIFFIKHTSTLGREEASSSFNNIDLQEGIVVLQRRNVIDFHGWFVTSVCFCEITLVLEQRQSLSIFSTQKS